MRFKISAVAVTVLLLFCSYTAVVLLDPDNANEDIKVGSINTEAGTMEEEVQCSSQNPGTTRGEDRSENDVGSWLDTFVDDSGIEKKIGDILITDNAAKFSPGTQSFVFSSTSDFDSGTKTNMISNTDIDTIPTGEISMVTKILFEDSFEGADEQDFADITTDWSVAGPDHGTGKIDTNESAVGESSLRLRTNKFDGNPYYMGTLLQLNHTGW
jgi:hypothetical protein